MSELWPPIEIVEAGLFGSEQVADREVAEADHAEADLPEVGHEIHSQLPFRVREAIRRRVAADIARFSPAPARGQIVEVNDLRAPELSDDSLPLRPVCVLLIASAASGAWSGFVVSPDTDYASCWDLVLGPEDEPLDVGAEMVQAWNSVVVQVDSTARVLGQLSEARVAAVEALAREIAVGVPEAAGASRPGLTGTRLVGGQSVVTGTPLGGPADPRRHYQRLYLRATERVSVPQSMVAPWGLQLASRAVRFLEQWAAKAGQSIVPAPLVAHPLGASEEGGHRFRIIDRVDLDVRTNPSGTALVAAVSLAGEGQIEASIVRDGELLQSATVDARAGETQLMVDPTEPDCLVLRDAASGESLEIPLT